MRSPNLAMTRRTAVFGTVAVLAVGPSFGQSNPGFSFLGTAKMRRSGDGYVLSLADTFWVKTDDKPILMLHPGAQPDANDLNRVENVAMLKALSGAQSRPPTFVPKNRARIPSSK